MIITDIKNIKIAKRYANALYQEALEGENCEKIYNDLVFVDETIKSNKDLSDFILSPIIKKEDKKDVIKKLFELHIDKNTLEFLYLLIDESRENIISEVLNQYASAFNKARNIIKPIIKSAIELNSEQKAAVEYKLQTKMNKRIMPQYVVDNSIIGGLVIEIDDKTIDCSLKNKFDKMQKQLEKGNSYDND